VLQEFDIMGSYTQGPYKTTQVLKLKGHLLGLLQCVCQV